MKANNQKKYVSFRESLDKALQDKAFAKEYESLKAWRELQISLIDARNKANLTQEELAKKLNMKRTNLSRLESSVCANPTFDTLVRYARALGLKKLEIPLQ